MCRNAGSPRRDGDPTVTQNVSSWGRSPARKYESGNKMVQNIDAKTLYEFIVGDFEDAWNSLAANPKATRRGNFMFARQAMTLLEWAARLCAGDASGSALTALSQALIQIEPRYFTELPGVCADFEDFDLPWSPASQPQRQLLWALFDLIRNGQAHQYQQIVLALNGGDFVIAHNGADVDLATIRNAGRDRSDQLRYRRVSNGDLYLLVRPDWLLFDLRDAIGEANVLSRGLSFPYLERPRHSMRIRKAKVPGPYYQFDANALEAALRNGGHQVMQIGPR